MDSTVIQLHICTCTHTYQAVTRLDGKPLERKLSSDIFKSLKEKKNFFLGVVDYFFLHLFVAVTY